MIKAIHALRQQAEQELEHLDDAAALPEWYRRYLGRKGELTQQLKQMGALSPEERPKMGKVVNKVKQTLEDAFHANFSKLVDGYKGALLICGIDPCG